MYFEELKELSKNCRNHKSHFAVTSIIFDTKGNRWEGVNVEYAIPANAICAERNAISTALTEGFEFGTLKEVHILGYNEKDPDSNLFTPPCGVCRQAILEASSNEAKVYLYSLKGEVKEYNIKDLLPLAFTGEEVHKH